VLYIWTHFKTLRYIYLHIYFSILSGQKDFCRKNDIVFKNLRFEIFYIAGRCREDGVGVIDHRGYFLSQISWNNVHDRSVKFDLIFLEPPVGYIL
jgi:hypothetical protein